VTGEATFLMDRPLTKSWDALWNTWTTFQKREIRASCALRHGLQTSARQQFDLHVGAGLSSSAALDLVGVGYSFRLQAVRR
jgi:hypothetical protein